MTSEQPGAMEIEGIPCRIRIPSGNSPHPTLIMIHGHEGSETVTWIFTKAVGSEWLIASPRAPYAASDGYTWYHFDHEGHTDPESYQTGLARVATFIEGVAAHYLVDRARLVVLGFSQGAAMAYGYGLTHEVGGIVSLGGYIPGPVPRPLPPLNGKPVLIIHGTQDDTISVEIARKNSTKLTEAGAAVTYHEEAIGHKVGAAGMRVLGSWLAERIK